MKREDFELLTQEIKAYLATGAGKTFGIIGHTPVAYDLVGFFKSIGSEKHLLAIYDNLPDEGSQDGLKNFIHIGIDKPNAIIIASDEDKEHLLLQALPHILPSTKILLAGYGHFQFADPAFRQTLSKGFTPSFANGYPNSLIHIFECLKSAARRKLIGVVVEFGMFKGGTTMLMSHFIECLGEHWKILGFDTFAGFPPPRSPLDMYAHSDCVFLDESMVRRHVAGRNIDVISGDIISTVHQLANEDIILAFVDTDNFSSANEILNVIPDRIVPGGSIVFDHFTGVDRHKYTLGERIAAKRLLDDPRYFHLHGTGVFFRQY